LSLPIDYERGFFEEKSISLTNFKKFATIPSGISSVRMEDIEKAGPKIGGI
jgi:hypothetical protein